MIRQLLHNNWKMKRIGADTYFPATVPGSVYGDLLANGQMEDPFWRDNELASLKLMEHDYEYQCFFAADPALLGCDRMILRCEGLDTLADIYLNGNHLAYVNNMHRTWEFDVSSWLKPQENELRIQFHSPTRYIRERDAISHAGGSTDAMVGFPHLRKAHCMFGWDWGPRLPDAGIWRNIMLCGIQSARIESVYLPQRHQSGRVEVDIRLEIGNISAQNLSYRAVVTAPDGSKTSYENSPKSIEIEQPRLWWPHGYGEQPLYGVEIELYNGEIQVDGWSGRMGLRTMTVNIAKDEYGSGFAHEVNGVKVFAMGADYIPEDNLLGRVTPERTRRLLEQCAAANFNAIRVWGGGYYPDDWFYDACDELGLMVWQDFMFACAVYNLDEAFEENICQELTDNIKRLRNHPSLGLWCGNNEMEMFVDVWEYDCTYQQRADYVKMYEYLFPKLVKKHDPNTFYWPASPSSGGGFDKPNDPDRGDVHYWDVWHGNKPFSEYRKFFFRYASEFGFQSFPSVKTVESFTLPEDRNIFSYVMEKHQRNNAANGKIMNYLSQTYLYPGDFDALIYASQLLQAEAIKYGVEHWRRHRGRCMGAIYWQLNDCWPVASWASVDYYGRWKALHYFAKRFFAPVLLSCHEEGVMTQNSNVNREVVDLERSIRLSVANETMENQTVRVVWALRNADASVIQEGTRQVSVPRLSSVWLDKEIFADADLFSNYVSYDLYIGYERISGGTALFNLPKHFRFQDPHLQWSVKGDIITVKADAYAKSVEIRNENDDLVLSDNYFDMNGGEYAVKVISGDPDKLTLRSVYDIR